MLIRDETARDIPAISRLVTEALLMLAQSTGTEAGIGTQGGWSVIGPLVVSPSRHRRGIGTALMAEALRRLRTTSRGAALVGDPAYYGRFGFRAFPGLSVTGCPPEVVQALPFDGAEPRGELIHHPAFGLNQQE